MANLEDKRRKEKEIVYTMISLYCRKNHNHSDGLCSECEELYKYATMRIDKCPFMETKTFCSKCKVHCYRKDYKERIRNVMRFSGPRMLLYHPVLAIKHFILDKIK